MGNKLHLAPIGERPARILDVGTGTGIWAIEMGKDPGDNGRSIQVTGCRG